MDRLQRQAIQEAAQLVISPDQLAGRDLRESYTFDTPGTKTREDAVLVTHDSKDVRTLHYSVVDAAAFIPIGSAMERWASEPSWRQRSGLNIFPAQATQKLGLAQDQERPAITAHIPIVAQAALGNVTLTRERVIVAQTFDHYTTKQQLEREQGQGPVSDLYNMAEVIRRMRHLQAGKEPKTRVTTEFIAVLTIFAQHVVAQHMQEQDMPGIFRIAASLPRKRSAPSYISPNPQPDHPQFEARALWTSPFRWYRDYANQHNLAAGIEGREYPFKPPKIDAIMHYLVRQERQPYLSQAADIRQSLDDLTRERVEDEEQFELLRGRLVQALFGSLEGADEAIRNVRHLAARIIADYPSEAGKILVMARQNGWIAVKEVPGSNRKTLVMRNGEEFPYPRNYGPRQELRQRRVRLIRKIVGADADTVPEKDD